MISPDLLALWELGGSQVLLILLLALLFFGAKRLPELARSLGLAKKEFTKAAREVSDELEKSGEKPADVKPADVKPSASSQDPAKKA